MSFKSWFESRERVAV